MSDIRARFDAIQRHIEAAISEAHALAKDDSVTDSERRHVDMLIRQLYNVNSEAGYCRYVVQPLVGG